MGTSTPGVSPLSRAIRTYLDHLAVERGVADNTLAAYRRDLRRYAGFLAARGVTDVTEVTENLLSDFLVALREGDGERPGLAA